MPASGAMIDGIDVEEEAGEIEVSIELTEGQMLPARLRWAADGTLVLRFGGGCHGCGMVDVTLRDGIEKTLKARIPEVTGVRDATDHATGDAPYVRRATR